METKTFTSQDALNWHVKYTPFAVGLDDIFNRLENMSGHSTNYPPYNVVKEDATKYYIELAVAGFSREELDVWTEQNVLTVTASVSKEETKEYIHRGLAKRSFTRTWQLGDDLEVSGVNYGNGLLTISLEKIIPEKQKKKVYSIDGSTEKKLLTE